MGLNWEWEVRWFLALNFNLVVESGDRNVGWFGARKLESGRVF